MIYRRIYNIWLLTATWVLSWWPTLDPMGGIHDPQNVLRLVTTQLWKLEVYLRALWKPGKECLCLLGSLHSRMAFLLWQCMEIIRHVSKLLKRVAKSSSRLSVLSIESVFEAVGCDLLAVDELNNLYWFDFVAPNVNLYAIFTCPSLKLRTLFTFISIELH